MNNTRKYLEAKAVIAADLYHDGKITRAELFRNEVDLAVGYDSGPILYNLLRPGSGLR